MCEFFSAIATRDGRLFFAEENSHETIIARALLRDTDRHLRHWVRVEVRPDGAGWGPVMVDETIAPAWWDEDRAAIEARVLALAERVRLPWTVYDAACRPAWDAYGAAVERMWRSRDDLDQPVAERRMWAAYARAVRAGEAAYVPGPKAEWAAYKAIEQPARTAYESALRSIPGYLSSDLLAVA